jgi:hypothetical protein
VFDRDILPGGEGRVEVTIHGRILHPGRSMVTIDLIGNDIWGDITLLLQGRVLGPGETGEPPARGIEIEGANLLVR